MKIDAIAMFDIDGVIRDVGGSYRRALADTVEQFTAGAYRPSSIEIDRLKAEGLWNNDWEASQELIYRYFEGRGTARESLGLSYEAIVAFFQSRYRGEDLDNPDNWTGYISQEPLLASAAYFQHLTEAGIGWGFFSGATRGSATYVLCKRLGLRDPLLVAMEDAPGKPDPTGLLAAVAQWEQQQYADAIESAIALPVLYAGDTVADLYTVQKAAALRGDRRWIGVGILPPHVCETAERQQRYAASLQEAGAAVVLENIEQLDARQIQALVS
jgi:HAD superfamily phosphatase